MIMNKKVSSPGRIKASSSFDKKQSSSSSSSSSAKKKASSSKTSTNNDPNKKSSQKRQSKSAETTRLLREEEPSKKETGAQGGSCSSLLTEEENNWPIKKPSSASKIDGKQQRGRNAPSRSRSRSTDKKKKLGNNRSQSADNALTIRPSSTTTRNRSKSADKKVIRKEKPSSATGKTTHPRKEEEKLASHIIPPEDDESSSCSSSSSSGASVEQPSSSEDDGCDDSKPGVSSVAMTFMLKKQGLPTSNAKPDSSHRKRTETSNIFQKESKIVPDNSKKIIKIVNGKVVKILEDYSTEHEDEASKRSPTKTIASNREDNQQTIPLPSSPDRSMSRSPQGSRRSPDSPQSPDIFAPAKSPPRSTTRVMTLADMAALHSDSDESSSSDGEGEATQKSRKIKFVAQKQFLKTEKWTKKEEDLSRKKNSKDQSRAKTTAKEKKPEIIPGHQNEHSSSTKETAEFEDITDPAKNKPTISMWEMREKFKKDFPTEPAILRQLYKEEKMAEYERQERFRRDNAKEPVRSDDVLKLLYPPQKKNNCAALFVDKEVRGNELKVEASQPVQSGKEALLHRQDSELTFATTGPWEDYGSSGSKNEKKKDTFVGTMLLVTEEEEEEQHGGDVDKRHKSSWQSMAISAFCDKDKRKSNSNDWGGNSSFSGPTGNRKSRDGQQRSVKASQQSSPDLAWDGNFHRSFSAGAAKESNQGPAFEAAFDNIGDLEFDGFKIKTHTATEIMQNNVQPEKKTWYEVDLPRRGGGDDESGIISHEPRLEDIRKRHRRTADRTGRDRSIERSRHNVDRSGHSLDRSGHGRLRRDKSRERSRQDAMNSSSGHLSAHFRSNRWGERRQKDGESSVHSSRSKDTSIRRNHRTLDSSSSHGRRKEPTRGIGRAKSEEQVAKYSSRAQENSFGHYFAGGLENFIADSQHPSSAPQNDRFSMDRMSQPGPSKEISIVQAPKTPVLQPSTRERRRARSFDNLKVVMDLEGPNVDESAARRMLRTPGAPTIPGARSKQGVYAPAGTPNGRSRGNATAATNWMAEIPGAFAPLQKPAAFELVVANSNEPVSPLTVATRVARPNISARRRGVPY